MFPFLPSASPDPCRAPFSLRRAFTLLELLVSMAVLALFVLLLFAVTDGAFKLWRRTASDIAMFDTARAAFDTMTRRLSQATLNTYLDYYNAQWQRRSPTDTNFTPSRYGRASDLGFYSGPAADIVGSNAQGHGVFFFAPLGFVDSDVNFADLPNLLNAVGYYVEWGEDVSKPDFLGNLPTKNRFRLIERVQPSQNFTGYPDFTNPAVAKDGGEWIAPSVLSASSQKNVLADNVLALIIRPELPVQDARLLFGSSATPESITADYIYDSWAGQNRSFQPEAAQFAQLPPMLRVVMIAVSEADVERLVGFSTTPPAALRISNNLLSNPSQLGEFLDSVTAQLTEAGVQHRIFNQVIPLRSAKFSAQPER
jgi:uncharacterized protein (TIGR02599 family)